MTKFEIVIKGQEPECMSFLTIVYGGKEYRVEQFAAEFEKGHNELEALLNDSVIKYRGASFNDEEYTARRVAFINTLPFHERYNLEIERKEFALSIANPRYFKAAKFIKKAELCLETGRYYLMESHELLTNFKELSWNIGYGPLFKRRTFDCSTAIVWYNSCFDHILQVVFFAFELYNEKAKFKNLPLEELLKKCTYFYISEVYEKHQSNENFGKLWDILSGCRKAMEKTTEWANYIKHKGGVVYKGLPAPDPDIPPFEHVREYQMMSRELEPIPVDLDDAISCLKDVHNALYQCLDDVVAFLNFAGFDENEKNPVSTYMPDILSIPETPAQKGASEQIAAPL